MTPADLLATGPGGPAEMIGKAASVARVLCGRAASGETRPIKALLYGDPGVGKSAICRMVANRLVEHSAGIHHASGCQVSPDTVRDWLHDLHYRLDGWRVFWIDEVDSVSPGVEVLLLQLLDLLPDCNAALFTSNATMTGITARFQSRTQAIQVERPAAAAVERFLLERWPGLGEAAREIAEANGGDVRASLNDAQMQLDAEKYL